LAINSLKVLQAIAQLIDSWLFIAQHLSKPKSDKARIKLVSTTVPARKSKSRNASFLARIPAFTDYYLLD
jgi:hypothetical protein